MLKMTKEKVQADIMKMKTNLKKYKLIMNQVMIN